MVDNAAPCDEQDEPYVTKFPELRWKPEQWNHHISEPQPPDLLRLIDDFLARSQKFWGLRR